MRHEDIWRAIDTLAAEKGLSASGLARAAGLDPTAFNRSKRAARDGRLRWPSTESLSRILAATGASLETFTALVGGARAIGSLRLATRSAAGSHRLSEVAFSRLRPDEPQMRPLASYAIRLDTAAFEPGWREGGVLIVSPGSAVHGGDRVVLCEAPAQCTGGILQRSDPGSITLTRFDGSTATIPAAALLWMHRVDWASF